MKRKSLGLFYALFESLGISSLEFRSSETRPRNILQCSFLDVIYSVRQLTENFDGKILRNIFNCDEGVLGLILSRI